MKKTLLTVLIVCMILSTVSVSAVTVTDNNYFSEYNVLYNRINSQQTMSTMSTNTTADSFDVVIGLDMSADVQAFDPSATYEWMEYFSVLPEQTETNTRFAVVTNELSGEFSVDPSADIAAAASLGYIEVGSAQVLLENCVSTFENTSSATKVILLATADVSNVDLLESAAEQLAENGIYMFVYLLNPYASETDCEYIYPCSSPLQLRLVLSDMYLSLAEYKSASSGSASTYAMTTSGNASYTSDYKVGRHTMYNNIETMPVGIQLASVLNIYGCVPLYGAYGEKSYNLLTDIDTTNSFAVLEAFLNKDFSLTKFETTSTSNFDFIWKEIAKKIGMFVETNKLQVLEKNLKRRFPVIAIENDGKYKIVSEYTEGQYDETSFAAVFDTALYLAATSANAQTVDSELSMVSWISRIQKTVPGENNTASALLYDGGTTQLYIEGTDSLPEWVAKDGTSYTFTAENLIDDSAINHLVVAFKTTFENGLADCYDPDPYYLLRRYNDIENSAGLWYYEYLSKATTLGIIRGDENSNFGALSGSNEEAAYVTRAEFVKMAFSAAGIQCEVLNDEKKHWAEKYMAKALEYGMVSYMLYEEDNNKPKDENGVDISSKDYYSPYFDDKKFFTRAEAAHIMNQLFLEKTDEVQVPTMLYRYDMDKVENSDDEKAIKWNTSVQSQASVTAYEEDVFQMFMNDIMVGDGTSLNLEKSLNRAEAVVLIMKPLFKLDDSFATAAVNVEQVYNLGDIVTEQIGGNDSFVFLANKSGTYRVTVVGFVNYTVSDVDGNELNGIGGNNSSALFNLETNNMYIIRFTADAQNKFTFQIQHEDNLNDLIFTKVDGGTFIYDNCPEYLLSCDLADSSHGNSTLIEAKNLTGIVDIATSKLIRASTLDGRNGKIHFDYLVKNNSNKVTIVEIERIGIHSTDGFEDDRTQGDFAGLQGWADYLDVDLVDSEKFIANTNGINAMFSDYKSYIRANTNKIQPEDFGEKGVITLNPGEEKWLLGDVLEGIDVHNSYGYSFFMITRIMVDGSIDLKSMAFENRENVFNPCPGKLYLNASERPIFVSGDTPEDDNELRTKYKGVAKTLPEVLTNINWVITDSDSTYRPRIFNFQNPNGLYVPIFEQAIIYKNNSEEMNHQGYTWVTHINPLNDPYTYNRAAESDMMGFVYRNNEGVFYFDTRHKQPYHNNAEIKDLKGALYDPQSISMGNFTVTEKYRILLHNDTSDLKKVSYILGTKSTVFFRYSINNNEPVINVKCETQNRIGDYPTMNELLNVELGAGETKLIELEIVIPNIGTGGFSNMLYAE